MAETTMAIATEHPAALAWARFRPDRRKPGSIKTIKRGPAGPIYLLVGAGPDGGDVVAKRRHPRKQLFERTVYETVLPHLDIPYPTYYGCLDEGDGGSVWLFLEAIEGDAYVSRDAAHRAAGAGWIARLHLAGADARVRSVLPRRGHDHYLAHLRRGRTSLLENVSNVLLEARDRELLHGLVRSLERLERRWDAVASLCGDFPETIIHGDLVRKNVRLRSHRSGLELVVFDWEMAGCGLPAIDLAQSIGRSLTPDLELYERDVRGRWPRLTSERITLLARLGVLFRALAGIEWASLGLAFEWVEEPMTSMRAYAEALDACGLVPAK